jgi:hypothetical protein
LNSKKIPRTAPVKKKFNLKLATPKIKNNNKIDDSKSNFLVIINKYKIKVVINCGNKRNFAPEIKKIKTGDPKIKKQKKIYLDLSIMTFEKK